MKLHDVAIRSACPWQAVGTPRAENLKPANRCAHEVCPTLDGHRSVSGRPDGAGRVEPSPTHAPTSAQR